MRAGGRLVGASCFCFGRGRGARGGMAGEEVAEWRRDGAGGRGVGSTSGDREGEGESSYYLNAARLVPAGSRRDWNENPVLLKKRGARDGGSSEDDPVQSADGCNTAEAAQLAMAEALLLRHEEAVARIEAEHANDNDNDNDNNNADGPAVHAKNRRRKHEGNKKVTDHIILTTARPPEPLVASAN